ncbi:MAG: ParB/RepB/Spo0J family partition protein [Deltaproteobacteria bacterium]|nr:ParB/RepB/Spo0J family partition protein [Deltaproteobacteria bacterium]
MSETNANSFPKMTKPAPVHDNDKDLQSSLSEDTSSDKAIPSSLSEDTTSDKDIPSSLSDDTSSDKDIPYSLSDDTSSDKYIPSSLSDDTSSDKDIPSSLSEETSSLGNPLIVSNPNEIKISDEIVSIDINKIEPDPGQPRKLFDPETLKDLAYSIDKNSLHIPLFVRENEQKHGFYIIVDGERRWRACKELNLTEIQCRLVWSNVDGYQIVALTQNLHREDLLPIEKANAFANLLDRLKVSDEKAKQKELMKIVNLSENYISEILKINTLPDLIKEEALKSKEWSIHKLLQLAKIKNGETRMKKFEETKASINNKGKKLGKAKQSENSKQDKKIINLVSRAKSFENHLNKFNTIALTDSQKEEIKPKLLVIQELIAKILS